MQMNFGLVGLIRFQGHLRFRSRAQRASSMTVGLAWNESGSEFYERVALYSTAQGGLTLRLMSGSSGISDMNFGECQDAVQDVG